MFNFKRVYSKQWYIFPSRKLINEKDLHKKYLHEGYFLTKSN